VAEPAPPPRGPDRPVDLAVAAHDLSQRALRSAHQPSTRPPRFGYAGAASKGAPMAGLNDKRGFIDKERLDLSERKAVEYWMKRWGVTKDQLTAAHRKVGRLTKDIAAELGKKR